MDGCDGMGRDGNGVCHTRVWITTKHYRYRLVLVTIDRQESRQRDSHRFKNQTTSI
jgi:hypothetical protein